jgi:thioredoxin 2
MSSLSADDRGVIVTCPNCGQKNRTPYAKLNQTGQCGRCQHSLPPPSQPIDADTEARFNALLTQSPVPILVDFWAPWCGPCLRVAPEMEKVAATNAGRFLVVKLNTEALPDVGARYGIRSIPTMALFADGKELTRTAGARPAADITAFANDAISKQRVA